MQRAAVSGCHYWNRGPAARSQGQNLTPVGASKDASVPTRRNTTQVPKYYPASWVAFDPSYKDL